MNLWNIKNLEVPPRNTYKVKNQNVDIVTLRRVVGEAIGTFRNDRAFKEEAALLSRCIYRMKLKFRSDKGLKAMEKMNRALLQYLRIDVPQMLETFYGMIPPKYGINTYLPTLNMLHYVLVRIQGLAKLMVRIVECAKDAAFCMEGRISIGHFWKVAFVCFTVVSKIFVLTKQFTKYCCKFYSQLYPFTKTLQNVGVQWLPNSYQLPNDLKTWLNADWLDKDDILIPKAKKLKIPTIFDMLDSDSDVEFCGEYTEIEDDIDIVDEYVQLDESGDNEEENKLNKEIQKTRLKILGHSINKKNNDIELTVVKVDEDVGEVVKSLDKNINIEEDKEEVIKPLDKNINSKKKRKKRKKSENLKTTRAKITKIDECLPTIQSKGNMHNQISKVNKSKSKVKNSNSTNRGTSVENNNTLTVQNREEDIGEIINPIDINMNSKKKKNKRKRLKLAKIAHVIDEIKTLKDLQKFEKNFNKIQQEHSDSFRNIDKLQRSMLHSSIKNYVGKGIKNCNNSTKVDSYVIKARNTLKLTLL